VSANRTGLYTVDEVYALLPQLYRSADHERGELRALLEVVTGQVNVLAESLEQLYDDQFIETAAPWVAPYLGDLIGYRTLHGVVPAVASPRAEVANTIRYRRRKGTASMLEQLARDVTGWPARVVEFFELLATTQHVNHVRPHAPATADLRPAAREELGARAQAGAFDGHAHTIDVRRIATGAGRHNIPNSGIFLWRVLSLELARSPLVAADDSGRRWRIDPLGTDRPLFSAGGAAEQRRRAATADEVPMPLRRRWLGANLAAQWGRGGSVLLEIDAAAGVEEVPLADVRICDLSDDPGVPGAWNHEPAAGSVTVAIDPVLGRIAVGTPPADDERLLATFRHGAAIAVGGGGYDRPRGSQEVTTEVAGGGSLVAALGTVDTGGVIEIVDNERYTLPGTIGATSPPSGDPVEPVVLRAANRVRPHLSRSGGHTRMAMEPDTTVVLDGLLLAGAPLVIDEVADTGVRTLVLRHCTLVPGITRTPAGAPGSVGRASLIVLHPFANVVLEHCIVGPIVAVEDAQVTAVDSVIDASASDEVAFCGREAPAGGEPQLVSSAAERDTGDGAAPGGHLTLEACTVVGKVHARRLDVSDSILLARRSSAADPLVAPVVAERRQVGCIRFSSLPADARTPRRYRCVPREGLDGEPVPHHTSRRYGDAGYLQLRAATHPAIRSGASDESEMGVTHELHQPQRETNLRLRLDEYLRFGLEAGFFYAT
jgi:hypothetical protein